MIQTVTEHTFIEAIRNDEYNSMSYSAAKALFEYLEALEDDCDIQIELDTVAIRCDYSEYKRAVEYADQFAEFTDEIVEGETSEENEARALEFLQDNTTVIEFDGGIIVQSF